MIRPRLLVLSLGAVAAVGCAAGDPQAGRYVLLDPEARAAGVTLQVDDRAVTSALPVEVAPDAHVTVLGPSREEAVAVAPGELVYVAGSEATVSHLTIGKQVAVDQVHVEGDEGAARELASQLGGRVAMEGTGWKLNASEVFAATATARVPEHLLGVAPVRLDAAPAQAPAAGAAPARAVQPSAAIRGLSGPNLFTQPAAAPPVPGPSLFAVPALGPLAFAGAPSLGPSRSEATADGLGPFRDAPVVSPVAFVPAAGGCADVGGTWRGRQYSNPHIAYYDFTLNIRQRGSALQGNMVVEFWDASTDEIEPPSACGGAQHVRVVESATGTVDEAGTMHFAARGWQVSHHMCGDKVDDYSLDRFEVPLARDATTAEGTASDDAMWPDGLPIAMTRVRCAAR
jgi:hypothetical protein